MSDLRPGMIALKALDLGEMRPDYFGCDSASKAKKKVFPRIYVDRLVEEIKLPDEGEAKVTFRVVSRSSRMTDDGKRHGAEIEIRTIEAEPAAKESKTEVAGEHAKPVRLGALQPGMIALAADPRPRNGQGQFTPQADIGPEPGTMVAAYGNVEAEKAARRRSLIQRLRDMIGKS